MGRTKVYANERDYLNKVISASEGVPGKEFEPLVTDVKVDFFDDGGSVLTIEIDRDVQLFGQAPFPLIERQKAIKQVIENITEDVGQNLEVLIERV